MNTFFRVLVVFLAMSALGGGIIQELSADTAGKKMARILPDLIIANFEAAPDRWYRDTYLMHLSLEVKDRMHSPVLRFPPARNFKVRVLFMPVNERGQDLSGRGWQPIYTTNITRLESGATRTILFSHHYPECKKWDRSVWRDGVTYKYQAIVDHRNDVAEANEKNNKAKTEFFFI